MPGANSPRPLVNYLRDPNSWSPRVGRKGGLRIKWKIGSVYEPVFPRVFRDWNLERGPSYDVLKTHYTEAIFGDKPLMRLEHLGCYELLYYQSERGEAFHIQEMAKRLAISRHTLSSYFDVLENLFLITRVRNAKSYRRTVNIVMRAPLEPHLIDREGYKLFLRVHGNHDDSGGAGFIQAERRSVGAARWPLLQWDFATMIKMLEDSETYGHLATMKVAIDRAVRSMTTPGSRYEKLSEVDWLEEMRKKVYGECQREGYPYTDRLFQTAIAIERLNATMGDE